MMSSMASEERSTTVNRRGSLDLRIETKIEFAFQKTGHSTLNAVGIKLKILVSAVHRQENLRTEPETT